MNTKPNNPFSKATPKDYIALIGLIALIVIVGVVLDLGAFTGIGAIFTGVIWGNYIRSKK